MRCEVCDREPALIELPIPESALCVGGCRNPAAHIEELHGFAVQLDLQQETMGPTAAEAIRQTLHEGGRAFGVEICNFCHAPAGTPPANSKCFWPKHSRMH